MPDIETLMYLLSNLFRIYVLYRFTEHAFSLKERNVKKVFVIIAFVLYFFVNSISYILMPDIAINILSNVIPYFTLTFCYQSKLSVRFLMTIITYAISIFIDVTLFSIQSLLQVSTIVVSSGIATSICMFLAETLYEYFFTGNGDRSKADIRSGELLFIIFIPLGSLIIAFRVMHTSNSNYLPEAVILFAINIIVFYMYDALKKGEKQKIEKMQLEQQNLLYVNQIQNQRESDEKMRILRHDMKNHIYQIQILLERKEYSTLEGYMSRMLESTGTESVICNSGNYDVDGIVNLKLSKAKEMGAKLHLDIKIPKQLHIDSFDLNRILGNLFDNVLNVLEKVNRRIVYFQMFYEKGVVHICVRNSFSGEIKINAQDQLLSLKKDSNESHGYGIKSVVDTVEKYHGEFEYEYEENVFSVYIMMYEK